MATVAHWFVLSILYLVIQIAAVNLLSPGGLETALFRMYADERGWFVGFLAGTVTALINAVHVFVAAIAVTLCARWWFDGTTVALLVAAMLPGFLGVQLARIEGKVGSITELCLDTAFAAAVGFGAIRLGLSIRVALG